MHRAECNHVSTGSVDKAVTYVVLVILIALWAIVLVPPYLKDRRAARGTFRMSQSGSLPPITNAQRFGSLQHTRPAISSSIPSSMAGPAVSPVGRSAVATDFSGTDAMAGNVVPLHPLAVDTGEIFAAPLGLEAGLDESWEPPRQKLAAMPSSTAAARERRRHVLMALTGGAFATLLLAMGLGGMWVAINVALDAALVGYVILLVRFRQVAAERHSKVEPIRPPVTEQPPLTLQAAPAYLLRSGT